MKLSSPLPQPLPQECLKAAKIFRSFVTSGNNGLDRIIPHSVLQRAKGFVIFTVVKAGFVFSARAGSGLVIARLPDGTFSAPSAIGTAGMGFGGQAGAEVTDFLIVLNSRSAIRSFMSAGSLTLGGNMSLAVGPLGRNGEAMGALNTKGRVAAMYSYSKTKGLFGGISVEGSVIVERQDANALAYEADVTAKQILSGSVTPPHWADSLIELLKSAVGDVLPGWVDDDPMSPTSENGRPSFSRDYSFGAVGSDSWNGGGNDSTSSRKSLSLNPFSKKPANKSSVDNDYFNPDTVGTPSYSPRRASPPRSPTQTTSAKSRAFDGFAEDDDWGDSPGFRPAASTSTSSASYSKFQTKSTTAAHFPTHFDSDFVPDAPVPRATSPPQYHPGPPDPFSALTTPLNAFSFSMDNPQQTYDTRAMSPVTTSHTGAHGWADQYKFNTAEKAPVASSHRSNSPPPFDDPSYPIRSQSAMSNKPIRSLSVKRGLKDPAPPGVVKAIAMFDYAATEPGDLSFREGDVIFVLEKTNSSNDWWTGKLANDPTTKGIFPANFVTLDS